MPELQRLRSDHAPAILAFELANRAFFAASIPDRGDEFFERFAEQLAARLAEQETGACAFHVLVDDDGSVLGRFNLVDIEDGTAELGFRVAQHVTGRGVATATVRELSRRAATEYGLHTLKARASLANVASRQVLIKTGFVPVGPTELSRGPATWFELDLSASREPSKPLPCRYARSAYPGRAVRRPARFWLSAGIRAGARWSCRNRDADCLCL